MNDDARQIADILARRHGPGEGGWQSLDDVRPPELILIIMDDALAIEKYIDEVRRADHKTIGNLLDEVYRVRTGAAIEGELIARIVGRYRSLPANAREQLNSTIDRLRGTSRGVHQYADLAEAVRRTARKAAGMNQFFNRQSFEQELEARDGQADQGRPT